MADGSSGSYAVRFRHTQGDVGPLEFAPSSSAAELKDRLYTAWPSDGALGKERPGSPAELRLICSGRFLEDGTSLSSLAGVVGEPSPGLIVTIHVVVRPPAAAKAAGSKADAERPKSGCCVIS